MRRQSRKNYGRIALSFLIASSATLLPPCAAVSADDTFPKPQVKISSSVYDFGTVAQGSKVSHEFTVQNVGNADLVIHRIVPACGCTAATASGDSVAPGKTGTIKVDLDTSDFSGDKLKLVRIFTNDTDTPTSTLTLKGRIEPDVVMEPARVTFNHVVRGASAQPEKKEVSIQVREGTGIEISEIKSFSSLVSVKTNELTPSRARFTVMLDPSAPAGELRDRVVVNFKGAKEMSLNVPVYANIEGSLRLSPGSLSFGIIEGDAPIERSVKFENLGPAPVAIKSVSSSDPAVAADYVVIKGGTNYVLHVKLDPKKVSQDLRAMVTVTTDSKTEAPIALNVFGMLPPKS